MSAFEYAMVLVSIIIGLGITHILTSLGSAVHRLRGHGRPLRIDLNYLAWTGFVFAWLVQFWWWEFKWTTLDTEIDFRLYSFLVLYAVAVFMLAVILVPHRLEVVDDTWEYFRSIRPWFYGGLLVLNGLDLVDTFMKGWEWGIRESYLWYWLGVTACGVTGLLARGRRVHLAMGLLLVTWSNALTFYEQFVLGRW